MELIKFLTFDLPVEYKKIKLYPIKVKDYLEFSIYSQCLNVDKDSIPDPAIISMSKLKYFYHLAESNVAENNLLLIYFDRLLSLCLPEDESFKNIEDSLKRYRYDEDRNPYFLINEEKYNSRDFEKILKIIAEQNDVDTFDENISKEVRDSLEKAAEYKRKLNNEKIGSFEDYIVSLATLTGWSFEYIYGMTIRKFTRSIRRLDNYIHYKIYLSASMSGMVEFKDKSFIKHWLTNLDEEDKYKDVSVDLDTVQKTISLESAK